MTAGIGRKTAFRIAGVLSTVGVAVVVVALALGVVAPGASGPLDAPASTAEPAHENPATITDEASLSEVEQQLAARLAQQVESGAVNLTREDYEQARQQVGNETLDQLVEEYGEVAQQTGQNDQYTALARAQQAQENHTNHVAAYWDSYERYQRLTNRSTATNRSVDLPAGVVTPDSADATLRDIARELEYHATRVNETAGVAIEAYRKLSAGGAIDYNRVIDSLADSRTNVTSTQETVRREQFVTTELQVYAFDDVGSPTDPLELFGKLQTTNGTALAEQNVTVTVGNTTRAVMTDSGGRFRLQYRPTSLPTNTSTIEVAYGPDNTTRYLGDSETVGVTIEQADPTVDVALSSVTARYDDRLTVTGTVTAGNRVVEGVPYLVAVDDVVVAQGETNVRGRIVEQFVVPSDVDTGTTTVSVRLLTARQALAPVETTAPLTIERTASSLSVEAASSTAETVRVRGRLATETGGVAGQRLTVRVNGTVVGTTRTDDNGSFEQAVIVPEAVVSDGDGLARVNVTYSGSGTNIAPAQAETTTTVAATQGGIPAVVPLLGGGVVVVVLGWYLVGRVRTETATVEPPEPTMPVDADTETDATTHVEYATDLLAADDAAGAVRAGYAALRQKLRDRPTRGQTHWEFYHACRDRLDDDSERRLRTVTEYYERVAFAGEQADEAMAREVIEAAESLGDTESVEG